MSDYVQIAAMQLVQSSGEIERYLKVSTGRTFKLKKPIVTDGETRVIAKFVVRKSAEVDGVSYWPMFRYILDYNRGYDEYQVETEFWDDLKLGKPALSWMSGRPVPLNSVFSPSVTLRMIATKAKERMDRGVGKGEMRGVNQVAQRSDNQNQSFSGKRVKVRMPMLRRDRKTGNVVQTYAVYTGHETDVADWVKKKTKVSKVYALKGKRKGSFLLKVFASGGYSFYSGSKTKPIATGTMSDRFMPEVIVR